MEYLRTLRSYSMFSAITKILWGLLLLNPYWDTFFSSISYMAMARFFSVFNLTIGQSEILWGSIMFISGLAQALIYIRRPVYSIFLCFLSMWLWMFIFVMFFISNPQDTAGYVYGMFVLFDFINIVVKEKENGKWDITFDGWDG